MSIHVESYDHWNKILQRSSKPIVIKFSGEWCGPCKALVPVYEIMASDYNNATFLSIDMDDLPDIAEKFNVASIPAMFILYGGEIVKQTTGASSTVIQEIRSKLNAILN